MKYVLHKLLILEHDQVSVETGNELRENLRWSQENVCTDSELWISNVSFFLVNRSLLSFATFLKLTLSDSSPNPSPDHTGCAVKDVFSVVLRNVVQMTTSFGGAVCLLHLRSVEVFLHLSSIQGTLENRKHPWLLTLLSSLIMIGPQKVCTDKIYMESSYWRRCLLVL